MLRPWILAARPKTLTAGIIPVLVASALVSQENHFHAAVMFMAIFCSICIQIGTNFVNDASDFEKGADTEDRLGPPRMAAQGMLTTGALYRGAALLFFLSFLGGLYLVKIGGLPILAIGLVSILFAIAYTKGPFPLAYLGLGDLFVFLFFGLVAVLGTIYCHGGKIDNNGILLATIVGFLGVTLIAVNNLRDIPTDKKVGKRTLAVFLGDQGTRVYYSILVLLVFGIWIHLSLNSENKLFWLPLVSLPLALRNIYLVNTIIDRKRFNPLLGASAGLQMIFGILLSISLVFGH